MKDMNGVEIDFANETLFPPEYMIAKKNRENGGITHITYIDISEEEFIEKGLAFMAATSGDETDS